MSGTARSRARLRSEYDVVDLSIAVDVEFEIHALWPPPGADGSGDQRGTFSVVGPASTLARLSSLGLLHGFLSPKAPCPKDERFRAHMGIPPEAEYYAHVHPMDSELDAQAMGVNLVVDEWALVVVLGGFAYLDGHHRLLRVNAFDACTAQDAQLMLIGPFPVSRYVYGMLEHAPHAACTCASS